MKLQKKNLAAYRITKNFDFSHCQIVQINAKTKKKKNYFKVLEKNSLINWISFKKIKASKHLGNIAVIYRHLLSILNTVPPNADHWELSEVFDNKKKKTTTILKVSHYSRLNLLTLSEKRHI